MALLMTYIQEAGGRFAALFLKGAEASMPFYITYIRIFDLSTSSVAKICESDDSLAICWQSK